MSGRARPIAVALAYSGEGAPRVVAKGEGALAERIAATAAEHGVAVEENPALAAALATVDLDQEIPVELYKAVAIVIGAVLRAAKR
jgi:flagellar biosynthesis protein